MSRDKKKIVVFPVESVCLKGILGTNGIACQLKYLTENSNTNFNIAIKCYTINAAYTVSNIYVNCSTQWLHLYTLLYIFENMTRVCDFPNDVWTSSIHGPLTRYVNCGLHMRRGRRERFPHHLLHRKPLVSNPGKHHAIRHTGESSKPGSRWMEYENDCKW